MSVHANVVKRKWQLQKQKVPFHFTVRGCGLWIVAKFTILPLHQHELIVWRIYINVFFSSSSLPRIMECQFEYEFALCFHCKKFELLTLMVYIFDMLSLTFSAFHEFLIALKTVPFSLSPIKQWLLTVELFHV